MRNGLRFFGWFVALALVQVLLLNNFSIYGARAYLYVMFLLLVPINMSTKLLMPISFLLGLVVDIFSGTLGVHAAVLTFMSLVRYPLIRLLVSNGAADDVEFLSYQRHKMGFLWVAVALVVLHHFTLLMLEAFSFTMMWVVLKKTLLSSCITLVLMSCVFMFRRVEGR